MGRVLRRILRSVMCRCNANTEEMGRACCDQLHGAGGVSCVLEKKNVTGITLPRKSHFYMVQILICKHSVSGYNHLKMGFEARVFVGITYGCPPECSLKAAVWALELEMVAAPLPEPHCPGQKSFCCSGSRLPPPWNGVIARASRRI